MTHTSVDSSFPSHVVGFAHPHKNVAHMRVEHGMTIADLGAGSGAYVYAFAEALENSGTLYAIDVQNNLLRRIHHEAERRHFKNVNVIWGDLEKVQGTKLPNAICDIVLLSNILFQVEHKSVVLREAHRIVKQNGHVAIIDWSDSFNNMGPVKSAVVTKEKGIRLAEEAGFTITSTFDAGAHHWGLLCEPMVKNS